MGFAKFMASVTGRIIRIIAGLILVYIGFFMMKDVAGYIIAAIGLVPLFAGIFDFCVLAPLFGAPFLGKEVRRAAR